MGGSTSSVADRGPIVFLLVAVLLLAMPSPAVGEELREFTGEEFNDLFTTARLDNLSPIGPAPSITGDPAVDERIRQIGEERGYRRRPLPSGPLASVGGQLMQTSAVEAWLALRDAAKTAGHTLVLESTYRSHAEQTSILLRRLYSTSDSAIDYRLRYAAVPGYSKHHTGYAIDITQPGYAFYNFGASPAYQWLSANNYANAKKHGWIPSYPPDAGLQGPLPEAWEFTYVGLDNIWCYGFEATQGNPFCDDDRSVFETEVEWMAGQGITSGCDMPTGERFCPNDPLTRGQLAAFLRRALGDSVPRTSEPQFFVDATDSIFVDDIAWLSATGITKGCAPHAFCPDEPVTRGQLAAFFSRAFRLSDGRGADLFVDDDDSIFADQIDALAHAGITRGCNPPENDRFCPSELVTRGQLAAFLHRATDG
ncbi:MAG: M15 family metallopeptidase [Acidimicrobiia bacterium]|nr:M15 family metallopeptidase [Acidimicrobiia bacterium]